MSSNVEVETDLGTKFGFTDPALSGFFRLLNGRLFSLHTFLLFSITIYNCL